MDEAIFARKGWFIYVAQTIAEQGDAAGRRGKANGADG